MGMPGEGKLSTARLTRREFLEYAGKIIAGTSIAGAAVAATAFFFPPEKDLVPTEPVSAGNIDSLPLGKAKLIRYGRKPALVINTEEGLRSYIAICTHFACIVKWDEANKVIACPCHAGFFEPLEGRVLSGPPPKALSSLPVYVQDGQILVGGA